MNIDNKFIDGLGKLKTDLNEKVLHLNMIQRDIQQLSSYVDSSAYQYMQDLLHPETRAGVKVPSKVPVPSTTFQLNTTYMIRTSRGCAMCVNINPFFLASDYLMNEYHSWKGGNGQTWKGFWCKYLTSGLLVRGETYNGTQDTYLYPVNKMAIWTNYNLQQTVPDGLYTMYRLVSASLNVRYTGSIEKASGFLGGSITFEKNDGTVYGRVYRSINDPVYNPNATTYATRGDPTNNDNMLFNVIRNAPYNYEGPLLDGVRLLYFPPDKSFEEFYPLVNYGNIREVYYPEKLPLFAATDWEPYFVSDAVKSGFNWYVYGGGLPYRESCIRLELCCNFECLPAAKFTNYMPIRPETRYIDAKEKKQVLNEVMKHSVTKLTN